MHEVAAVERVEQEAADVTDCPVVSLLHIRPLLRNEHACKNILAVNKATETVSVSVDGRVQEGTRYALGR